MLLRNLSAALPAALLLPSLIFAQAKFEVSGERKAWHRVTVTVQGPSTSEDATPNPFRDYRMKLTFRHAASKTAHVVPGYFAADGNAAETSAKSGNRWRAHFAPDRAGDWRFEVSFRQGPDLAMSLDPAEGSPVAPDGLSGAFRVTPTDKTAPDFRARGLLQYTGGHYLRHAGNNEYFLKGGADSPENFLAYFEFDDTFDTDAEVSGKQMIKKRIFIHKYEPHARDWRPGDPVWKKTKGKNIIGALNYLSTKQANSIYFLTYNLDGGDGRDTWMWTAPDVRDRYDVSKLDQWEIVFSHAQRKGILLHFVTQETENDRKLGGGPGLNPVRKLYYRELVARFAHHPALVWNQGEENNTSDADRKEIARYIRALDAYQHAITVHTKNNRAPDFYNGLLGDGYFEATSIQGEMRNYNRDAVVLRQRSAAAGRKWAIFGDEQPPANVGVMPDADDPDHDVPRKLALWGNLMGGGSGVEWYFGYKFAHMDLDCEDFRSREKMWDQTRHALAFFRQHLPFQEMEPDNSLAAGEPGAYAFARPGAVYAVYLPEGGQASLRLEEGNYTVRWYNPRAGGALAAGSVTQVRGPGPASLGQPPADAGKDWAVLVQKAAPPAAKKKR